MVRKFLTLVLLSLSIFTAKAQSGAIKGIIIDAKTKESLIGAAAVIKGTNKGAQADLDGNFIIENLADGNYTVAISFISYTSKEIPVAIKDGKTVELPSISMQEEGKIMTEVVIKAAKKTNTETAILVETKKLEQIAVGISAQQIAKTQDRDASQVMRRVPGVSIMDNRFVMIRGLNERYNTVLLNDAITPSTEVDVRSFSFDLIPSNAIDRMLIFKTASAENSGEMAGGIVKIYTKSRPEENSTNFGIAIGYRSGVTFNNTLSNVGGKIDGLGFDDGTRALPKGFASRSVLNGSNRDLANEQFRSLSPFFALKNQQILPDFRVNLGLSRLIKIGEKELSNISNVNYSVSNALPQNALQERYEGLKNDESAYNWLDNAFAQTVRVGAMSNFSMPLNDKSRLEFRNLFNQTAINETLIRNGSNNNEGIDFRNYAFRYESRTIYSGQLNGTHELSDNSKLTWNTGYGFTNRYEPDYRRITTSRTQGATDQPFKIDVPPVSNPSLTQAARFWSALNEHAVSGAVNFEQKMFAKEREVKLRAGVFGEYKNRDFNARWFGYVNPKNSDITKQTPSVFFDPNNISNNSGGVSMLEGTNFDDQYQAQNLLTAAYTSVFIPLTDKLQATIGFRGEFNRQQLQSRLRGAGTAVKVDNPIFSPLPSVNMTYNLSEKQKLRFAYGMTVNRPEFRELAPFSYYDFNLNLSKTGNPDLKTANIHNVDARYEIYPNNGEMITIAAFYKHFINPIEVSGRAAGSGTAFFFSNPNSAKSAGAELEIRKILRGVLNDRLTVVANASVIYSRVDASNLEGQLSNRPLQGQSPYLINAGFYYNGGDFQANILYNVIGKRIFVAGDKLGNQTIYEMPRNVVDVNFTKSIGKFMELKLGISDILNQKFRYTSDTNNDAEIDVSDKNWQSFNRGTMANLGVNFKF
ncbi:MAG: carboxypeptidase-like regulatory domain-containing protein [Saprospiraceae bacterium]|nr:carboxypeptidase-like regulatory domain-containing protein [Saprospiraceae bacterium]